jgi:hypothetical protein
VKSEVDKKGRQEDRGQNGPEHRLEQFDHLL